MVKAISMLLGISFNRFKQRYAAKLVNDNARGLFSQNSTTLMTVRLEKNLKIDSKANSTLKETRVLKNKQTIPRENMTAPTNECR